MSEQSYSAKSKIARSERTDIVAHYVPVGVLTKWTFECSAIRQWVEGHLEGRVLNACCGTSRLNHDGEIVRNDLDPERDADHHLDATELATVEPAQSFDTIVFDPPWTVYQSNLRYDGRHVAKENVNIDLDALPFETPSGKEQLGHARLIKDGFDYLLAPGGRVIQLTFHGTNMPARRDYRQVERVMFDPKGEAKTVIGSVDQKMNRDITRV